MQKIFPDAVSKDANGYLMIRQNDMFYAMINSIKQLDSMIQKLEKQFKEIVAKIRTIDDKIIALIDVDKINSIKIKELEAKNKALEKQNKAFEARLKKLEARKY